MEQNVRRDTGSCLKQKKKKTGEFPFTCILDAHRRRMKKKESYLIRIRIAHDGDC